MTFQNFPDRVELKVTSDDLRRGEPRNCHLCPVVLAACRAFTELLPELRHNAFVTVGHLRLQVSFQLRVELRVEVVYALSQELVDLINEFDDDPIGVEKPVKGILTKIPKGKV